MLRALFGYTSTPEVATFIVWLTYIVVILALYLRPIKRPPAPAAVSGSAAPAEG
jgi:high-affinity Fe2+/Pb2+ permease